MALNQRQPKKNNVAKVSLSSWRTPVRKDFINGSEKTYKEKEVAAGWPLSAILALRRCRREDEKLKASPDCIQVQRQPRLHENLDSFLFRRK